MMYDDNNNSKRVDNDGGGVGDDEVYRERVELVLVSLSDLYSELDLISVCVSKFSSSFISYFLLTTFSTDCCSKERINDFSLRRLFYFKQDLKDVCCSST